MFPEERTVLAQILVEVVAVGLREVVQGMRVGAFSELPGQTVADLVLTIGMVLHALSEEDQKLFPKLQHRTVTPHRITSLHSAGLTDPHGVPIDQFGSLREWSSSIEIVDRQHPGVDVDVDE